MRYRDFIKWSASLTLTPANAIGADGQAIISLLRLPEGGAGKAGCYEELAAEGSRCSIKGEPFAFSSALRRRTISSLLCDLLDIGDRFNAPFICAYFQSDHPSTLSDFSALLAL